METERPINCFPIGLDNANFFLDNIQSNLSYKNHVNLAEKCPKIVDDKIFLINFSYMSFFRNLNRC